nr:MAG: HeH/LEM domain protein [Bacteriophage sp.]
MPTIKEIQSIAKDRAVELPKKIKKADMIHILQEQEGNSPCYATKKCNDDVCLWYKDCQKAIK